MTTNSTTTTDIHERALLVWLTISTWSARRYDKRISEKVNADLHASSNAGRYNKFLLPGDAPTYKALVTLAGSIRAEHYTHTLAWTDEGRRLLPTANYMTYAQWYRDQQRALAVAIDAFARDYPYLKDDARVKLNGAYREEDYPDILDIRSRFALSVTFDPLPAKGDIRVDLASDQVAAIEADIQDRINKSVQFAVADSWTRLHDVVTHIHERLTVPDAIFRDSLIDNARELVNSLSRLNVTNDPNLEAMRARVAKELANADPETLRDDKTERASVARSADDILKAMSGLYEVA